MDFPRKGESYVADWLRKESFKEVIDSFVGKAFLHIYVIDVYIGMEKDTVVIYGSSSVTL